MRWGCTGAFCVLLAARSVPSFAGDAAEERLARAYYDEAVKELEKSGPAKARLMFERVIMLGPNSVGARLMVGECHKREGKLASAWRAYREAIDVATRIEQPIRAEQAARLAASLEPRLSKLHLQLPEDAWNMPGLVIRIDDKVVDAKTVNMGFPVDVGEHVIDVSADGKRRVERRIAVENDGVRLDVKLEAPQSFDPPAAPAPASPKATETSAELPPAPPPPIVQEKPITPKRQREVVTISKGERDRRTAAYTIGAFGTAALIAGGVVGIVALERRNASNDGFCQGNMCTATGIALRNDSIVAGNASTGLLIAGAVLGGAGATLLLWPVKKNERMGLAVGPTGFAVRGSF